MNFEEIRDKYFYLVYRMQERYGLGEEGLAELTITYLETIERNLWKVGIRWSAALQTRLDQKAKQLCQQTMPEEHEPYHSLRLAYEDDEDLWGLHAVLEELLSTLTPREAEVIRLRYYEGLSCSECGKLYGLSRSRINQLEHDALRRLRHWTRARKLRAFL